MSLSRLLCTISHSGNMIIYCMSNSAFRDVLCSNICLKSRLRNLSHSTVKSRRTLSSELTLQKTSANPVNHNI